MAAKKTEVTMANSNRDMKLANALMKRYPIFTIHEIMRFKEEFDEFDIDGSGDIDKYEVMQMFEKFGEKVPKKAAVAMIQLYDQDGEGTIGFDEFVKMMYDLQMGTVDATNGFLRAYILDRASLERWEG
ncbi:hypothetical protein T484DRAFT_1773498 [Baffinella frigidus]|nr:hypothetical protein T484DRAFT_1773498 [Cryptophyta sp. CCMP2293]